jgi:tetratricopeptide (TPR) repeat protein
MADPHKLPSHTEDDFQRLTAALGDCLARGDADDGLRLAVVPGRHWWTCGRAADGRRWLEAFLALPVADNALRCQALITAGGAAYALADYAGAKAHYEEALGICEERDRPGVLNQLGMVAREQCRFGEARALHEEALGLFRQLGDEAGVAWCVNNLGVVAFRLGELAEARRLHEDALARRRRHADDRDVASSLGNVANVARLEGDLDAAWRLHESALATRRRLGDRWGVAGSLLNLAVVEACRGEHDRACELLGQAEAQFREVGDALGQCECHDARVLVAALREEPIEGLLQVAEEARAALGAPHAPVFREELRKMLDGRPVK